MLWWTLRQLKSKDWVKRERAVKKLGQFKNPRVVEALVATLRNYDEDVREAAAKALESLGWQPVDDTQGTLRAIALRDWNATVNLGAAAVELLVATLKDGSRNLRSGAAWALWNIGGARAVEPLVAALKDEYRDVRETAAHGLGRIGDARAVKALVMLALKDRDVASQAVYALTEVLQRSATKVSSEDLRAVARLNDVVGYHYNPFLGCGQSPYGKEDCSHIRQLARQELIRRGLKA